MKEVKPNHYIDTVVYDIDQALTCFKLRAFQFFNELGIGITSEQFAVLDTIYSNNGICQRELSKLILKDRSNTTRILSILENNGFIDRVVGKKQNYIVKQLFITEKGKKIEALETLDFQLNILYNSSSLQRQAQLLVCALNDLPQIIDSTKRLSVAYMTQDLNLMQQIAEERQGNSCDPSAQEMESMITARNQTWAKKLPTLIETAPSFIAVGALHLP